MGLQLRLRHPLGSKVIDLPDRSADKPIMVGRAASAEVQVPSFSASEEHCGLYVHAGHWYVQDCSGAGETYVNGQPADEPTALAIGDYIQLGSESHAPTLEVEPAAAAEGRTGYAMASPAAARPPAAQQQRRPATGGAAGQRPAAQRQPAQRPPQHAAPPQYVAPAAYPGQSAPGYAAPAGYVAEPAAASDDGMAGWGETASYESSTGGYGGAAAPARRPIRRQNNNTVPIIVCIAIGLVVVGGVLWWALARNKPAPVTQQPAPPPPAVKSGKTSLFLEDGGKSGSRGTPKATNAPAESTPASSNDPKTRKPEPAVIEPTTIPEREVPQTSDPTRDAMREVPDISKMRVEETVDDKDFSRNVGPGPNRDDPPMESPRDKPGGAVGPTGSAEPRGHVQFGGPPPAKRIVFVLDVHGSALPYTDLVKSELRKTIDGLRAEQSCSIRIAPRPDEMTPSTDDAFTPAHDKGKEDLRWFIDRLTSERKRQETDVVHVMKSALKDEPDLIYLLVGVDRADAADIATKVAELNPRGKVKINCVVLGDADTPESKSKAVQEALLPLARQSGGMVNYVRPTDIK